MRIKNLKSTLIFTFILMINYSCQEVKNQPKNSVIVWKEIVGEWKVSKSEIHLNDRDSKIIESKKIPISAKYIFNTNKTFTILTNLKNFTGNWSYDPDKNILNLNYKSDYKEIEQYMVTEFEADIMTLKLEYEELGYTKKTLSKL